MRTSINIIDIILNDLSNIVSDIHLIKFGQYKVAVQDRVENRDELSHIFSEAIEIKERYRFPFWDSFNVSLFDKSIQDYSFLKENLYHNQYQDIQKIKAVDFNKKIADANSNDYLTFCSKIETFDNGYNHLPLFDFHIPISDNNQKLCIAIIKQLNLAGYLLNSGKSYHFYGIKLITEDELITLLSKMLLFSPIIDRAWVSHQLMQRFCCLRISKKYDRLPFELCYIE